MKTPPLDKVVISCVEERAQLRLDNEQLRAAVADCVAFLRGDISGDAQKEGIIREAESLLK